MLQEFDETYTIINTCSSTQILDVKTEPFSDDNLNYAVADIENGPLPIVIVPNSDGLNRIPTQLIFISKHSTMQTAQHFRALKLLSLFSFLSHSFPCLSCLHV